MNDIPRTRAAAKESGARHYYTGKPCKRQHYAMRFTVDATCKLCMLGRVKSFYRAHKSKARANQKAWRKKNPDVYAAMCGRNSARLRDGRRYSSVPKDFNLHATVPFYAEARRRTVETGIAHAVDHIIPIARGGLHTASNLQVLTVADNRAKGDRLITDIS